LIKLFHVHMDPSAGPALQSVLYSGFVGQGAKVDEFEARLAEYLGTPYVVTVNSGTAALALAYRLAGIGAGDEVISTPVTCQATNQPLLERGARIVWADVDSRTGNIDPVDVWRKVTPYYTKAIVAVHYGGYPCDLDRLVEIADEAHVPLIEDCAHAFGSEYYGAKIGAVGGRFRCFSFQAIKTLTCADGGLLVCEREDDYRRAKLLRWYGMDREDKTRLELRCEADVKEFGNKWHMNDVNAAVGLANLPSVPERIARARENAAYYDAELRGREINLTWPVRHEPGRKSSYWLYPVLVDNPARFIPFMKSRGVHTSQVHLRNDVHTCFAASRAPLPGVDAFMAHQVALPVGAWVTDDDRETIINAMREYDSGE
jgi:dTDP-4-amino-4,6-dideoxygalactose transaminase